MPPSATQFLGSYRHIADAAAPCPMVSAIGATRSYKKPRWRY